MSQKLDEKLFRLRQLAEAIVGVIDEIESGEPLRRGFCRGCKREVLWTKRHGDSIPVNLDGSSHAPCPEYEAMKKGGA